MVDQLGAAIAETRRPVGRGKTFLQGLLIGAICYLIAELLVPRGVNNPTQHDLLLAYRLGFVYAPVAGFCIGLNQKSWKRAIWGASIGIFIGCAYFFLCDLGLRFGMGFLDIMIAYPCLCGGLFAMVLGVHDDDGITAAAARFGKGLFAGLMLGITYTIVLNITGCLVTQGAVLDPEIMTPRHCVLMMWWSGPPALGVASGLFFLLLRWAIAPIPRRYPVGHCAKCGYNLHSIVSGICPECGEKTLLS